MINKIVGKIDYLNRKMSFFFRCGNMDQEFSISDNVIYKELKNDKDVKRLNFEYDQKEYGKRFLNKNVFCCLVNQDNQLLSYGWINPTENHLLGELNLMMHITNCEVLYDFNTFEKYRGRNYYPYLLQKISERNSKSKLIYSFPGNIASVKGITKAHFKFIGNIKGYNKLNYSKLINRYAKNCI